VWGWRLGTGISLSVILVKNLGNGGLTVWYVQVRWVLWGFSLAVWWSLHRLQRLPEEYGTIRPANLSFRLEGTHYAPSQPDEPDSRVSV